MALRAADPLRVPQARSGSQKQFKTRGNRTRSSLVWIELCAAIAIGPATGSTNSGWNAGLRTKRAGAPFSASRIVNMLNSLNLSELCSRTAAHDT